MVLQLQMCHYAHLACLFCCLRFSFFFLDLICFTDREHVWPQYIKDVAVGNMHCSQVTNGCVRITDKWHEHLLLSATSVMTKHLLGILLNDLSMGKLECVSVGLFVM